MMKNDMTNPHLITPPPELVQQWMGLSQALAIAAAFQAGADQDLEACVDFVQYEADWDTAERLRADRRPKPQSLKEQALAVLEDAKLNAAHYNILLRALEQLPE